MLLVGCEVAVAYAWDSNGKLKPDGVRSYTYDRANRLKEVTKEWLPNIHGYWAWASAFKVAR